MAKEILTNCGVFVGGVNLTDHCQSVAIEQEYDENDVTCMGDTAKTRLLGIQDAKISITFMQDFASSNVDATLRPLLGSNTGATVIIYKSGTTATSTSPKWTMVGLLAKYQPLNADVGKPSMVDVEFLNGSATGITFGTS